MTSMNFDMVLRIISAALRLSFKEPAVPNPRKLAITPPLNDFISSILYESTPIIEFVSSLPLPTTILKNLVMSVADIFSLVYFRILANFFVTSRTPFIVEIMDFIKYSSTSTPMLILSIKS